MQVRATRGAGTALCAHKQRPLQMCGVAAFESYAIMAVLPPLLPLHTNNTHRCSPLGGLDFGGPAVVEPQLVRPETLRRHLSVGLPLTNPKALPESWSGTEISKHDTAGR